MRPQLSILVPFYKDDVSPLLMSLDQQSGDLSGVEILIMDDGSSDAELTETTRSVVDKMGLTTSLHTSQENRGRSVTRNALLDLAQADWVLFLDADMRIDKPDFLQTYLEAVANNSADILFGGFEVEDEAKDPDTNLHRVLSKSSDCLSAARRNHAGAQFVASSNLCVRKSVLKAEPFDTMFTGWGWEDSEWAARVSGIYTLQHLDNPAVHLGLETTETLLSRFASSGANYRRFVECHPELGQNLPLYRISKRLKRVPGQSLMRTPIRSIVRNQALPVEMRVKALKLWRASHYAEALS